MDSLDAALSKLEDDLEDNPDKWFNNPRGWLYKPDYKREAQRRSSIVSGKGQNVFQRLMSKAYQKRWFALDSSSKLLRYYYDSSELNERGFIDITSITNVDVSHLQDAPPFSIDLISADVHYTITADNSKNMYRWALAIRRLLPDFKEYQVKKGISKIDNMLVKNNEDVNTQKNEKIAPATITEKWYRYDFTYDEEGPMYMNVAGIANKDSMGKLLNQWVVVTSFELTLDGSLGRSEASGCIAIKDYVVGVNGIDLTTKTFNDAMDTIAEASFPKTLHFLRDNEANRESSRIESWVHVFYPALNRRRKRYVEIKESVINFRKPAIGGAANADRDAYFEIENITKICPIFDKNYMGRNEHCYILRIHCRESSQIHHVGINNESIGGSHVEILEFCFDKESRMNSWRSALVSSTIGPSNISSIMVESLETVEVGEVLSEDSPLIENKLQHDQDDSNGGKKRIHSYEIKTTTLGIKSELTGTVSKRHFSFRDGTVYWSRMPTKGQSMSLNRSRSLLLVDSTTCQLLQLHCYERVDASIPSLQYKYELRLITSDSSISICMEDKDTLLIWVDNIKGVVSCIPSLHIPSSLNIPTSSESLFTSNHNEGMYTDSEDGNGNDNNDKIERYSQNFDVEYDSNSIDQKKFQGYLYKRNDRILPKGFSPQAAFQKVWVVIKGDDILCFRSRIEMQSNISPFIVVSIQSVIEVREATDSNVPENSFELVTIEKVHVFAATDTETLLIWLDGLSDLIEMRELTLQQTATSATVTNISEQEKIKRIQESILFSGGLTMKSVNLYTGISSWRDRFVVITPYALSYFSDAKDLYTSESIGDINLTGISTIETSREAHCAPNCAFEVTARVIKGGNEDGIRTFIFEARTPELMKQWMLELCNSTKVFELEPHDYIIGGFRATRNRTQTETQSAQLGSVYGGSALQGYGTTSTNGGRNGRGLSVRGRGDAFNRNKRNQDPRNDNVNGDDNDNDHQSRDDLTEKVEALQRSKVSILSRGGGRSSRGRR